VKKQEKSLKEEIEEVDRQIRAVNQEKTKMRDGPGSFMHVNHPEP